MSERDGGPAFPVQGQSFELHGETSHLMPQEGMSLRDWFAGQALAGLLSDANQVTAIFRNTPSGEEHLKLARIAYGTADAMLKARSNV